MYLEQPDKDQNELEEKGLSKEDTDIVKDGRPSDNEYTRSTQEHIDPSFRPEEIPEGRLFCNGF